MAELDELYDCLYEDVGGQKGTLPFADLLEDAPAADVELICITP